jgi:hypothetical protein
LSEQYLTSSQFFAHFLRQTIGRAHARHAFTGRSDFLIDFGMISNRLGFDNVPPEGGHTSIGLAVAEFERRVDVSLAVEE